MPTRTWVILRHILAAVLLAGALVFLVISEDKGLGLGLGLVAALAARLLLVNLAPPAEDEPDTNELRDIHAE